MLKRIVSAALAAALLAVASLPAAAQSTIAPGHVWGNGTSATRTPTDATLTSVFDQAFCATNGAVLARISGTWVCPGVFRLDNSGNVTSGTINKVTITAPATGSTLTIADGKTLTANASITLGGTDGKSLTVSNSGTLSGGDGFTLSIAASKTLTASNSLTLAGTDGKTLTLTNSLTVSGNDGTLSFGAAGKTLTVSNTLTFTGTDASSVAFGSGGTVAYTANNLSVFASTTSAQLAGVISDETGSGALVFANTPTLVTPVLGVATATSINKMAITAPATSSTLAVADGKTFIASNTLTFTGTDGTSFAFPSSSDTVVTLGATQTLINKNLTSPVINGGTVISLVNFGIRSSGSGAFDLTIANTENLTAGRTLTLTVNNAARTIDISGNLTLAAAFTTAGANALTLTTTGVTNVTLPTSGTLAALNIAQTFSSAQIFSALTTVTDLKMSSGHIYPSSDGTTALQVTKADGTTRIVNIDTTNARVGINKNAGTFDLDVNGAANIGGALTFGTATITGLTVNNSPVGGSDYFLYYDSANARISKCTVSACNAAGVAGVSAANGLTGNITWAQGYGVAIASGGTTITINAASAIPQGRLTLTSGTPVLISTVSAATTVYYTSYTGRSVPVYDGSNMTLQNICAANTAGACEISAALGSNWAANANYDWFVGVDSGTVRLCSGPAWSSATSRGTGAGTTELQQINGLWSNKVSMTCRYSNTSTFTCGVNQCTHVGSMRTGSAGQTNYIFGALAAGGTAASFGLWNRHNRVRVATRVANSTDSWTYATGAWQAQNGAATMAVSFIDGGNEDAFSFTNFMSIQPGNSFICAIGVGYDSTVAFSGTTAIGYQGSATVAISAGTAIYHDVSGLGWHTGTAIEYAGGTSCTFIGDNGAPTIQQTGLHFNWKN